jgi:inward rectifier potassium channel
MGTIGYGAMYPTSTAANLLVVFESIVSLVVTALATGLVFAKFSRPSARIMFSKQVVISQMNGVPTLMFRIGNERGNRIVDAQLRAMVSRDEITKEGHRIYRLLDLKLVRERTLSLSRSFSVMHVIDETSPFHGQDAKSIAEQDFELSVMLVGLDDISMQTIHASYLYFVPQILWNMRHTDILTEQADGSFILDLNKFHDVEDVKTATRD